MTLDAREDRTELRLQLLENGYVPLPNKNKICYMPGWNTVTPTPEAVRSRNWARSKALDTGVRCDDIIAIDWDINDEDLLNQLMNEVVEKRIIEESFFVRIGKPPREMWIYRISEPHGKRTTGMFQRPGAEKAEQVEILGRGCQFAAYGQRDAETAYTWPEQSLLDHHRDDLPEITADQIANLKAYAVEFFEVNGLTRVSPGGGTDQGYSKAYDLTPNMVFDVADMGSMTVFDMQEYFALDPDAVLRCEVSVLRPGTSGSWAGMVSMVGDAICVSDHGSSTTHFLPEADYVGVTERVAATLAKMFPTAFVPEPFRAPPPPDILPDAEMVPEQDFDTNMAIALSRYAYVSAGANIIDTKTGHIFSRDGFNILVAQYYKSEPGAKGATKMTRLSEAWMQHPHRVTVNSMHMRPDQGYPFYDEDGQRFVNTYRPTILPTHGDPSIGIKFLERLVPVAAERHWFTQWQSHLLTYPDDRMVAVVMVAHERYGTGRSSYAQLLRQMVGDRYTREIDFSTMTGQGSQSQYNEWQADAVLVIINEAKETPVSGSKWTAASNAYEHMKNIVDTTGHVIYVKRKGVNNYQGRTSASYLIDTNHKNAFLVPPGDRRFGLIENGQPLTPEEAAEFHAWRANPANVGAFREWLKAYSREGFNAFEAPPSTQSKLTITDAGRTALDNMMDEVISGLEGAFLTREQLSVQVLRYTRRVSITEELPENWAERIPAAFKRATVPVQCKRLPIDGMERTIRALRGYDAAILDHPEKIMAELMKNGPLSETASAEEGKVLEMVAGANRR